MVFFICRTRKHVGDAAAEDRSDDAESITNAGPIVDGLRKTKDCEKACFT